MNYSQAVRPSLLISLNSAASLAAGRPWTVTLDSEGGSGGTNQISVAKGDGFPAITTPVKNGYIFAGYYTQANGAGTKIYNADGTPAIAASTFTENVTLYANWTPVRVKLSFDLQGATTGTTTQTVTYNSALSNITAPTRTGYAFGGYYLFPNGQGTKIYNANGTPAISLSTFAAATTLYAYWLWYDIKSVTGSTTSYTLYDSVDATMKNTSLTIAPASGHKVASFSFDNTTWHNVDSVKKNLANTSLAAAVIYYANENSNEIVFEFKGISTSSPISFYLQTTAGAYSGLKNSTGSVKGVAVQATFGGVVHMVGEDIDTLEDDDTITLAADIVQVGYGFKHWKTSDGRVLSTAQSVKLKKSLINDTVVIAVFELVSSSNVNLEVDNTE